MAGRHLHRINGEETCWLTLAWDCIFCGLETYFVFFSILCAVYAACTDTRSVSCVWRELREEEYRNIMPKRLRMAEGARQVSSG